MVIVKNQDCSSDKRNTITFNAPPVQNLSQGLFNQRIIELIDIIEEILSRRGVCRLMIHFSKDQLTCWAYGDPDGYKIYPAEGIFHPSFMDQFRISSFLAPITEQSMPVKIPMHKSYVILEEFWRLRTANKTTPLRSAYFNRINGSLSLTFSYNGENFIIYSDSYDTAGLSKLASRVA